MYDIKQLAVWFKRDWDHVWNLPGGFKITNTRADWVEAAVTVLGLALFIFGLAGAMFCAYILHALKALATLNIH